MKNLFFILLLTCSSKAFSCGGDYSEWMSFYTLFNQENSTFENFKPFLRDTDSKFYDINSSDYYADEKMTYNSGNIKLWKSILNNWSDKDVETAVYNPSAFNWKSQKGKLLKRIKVYIEYANFCSNSFNYRKKMNSWNYEEILDQHKNDDLSKVLEKGIELFTNETNEQLKSRYAYQVIRILHYSKKWKDAILFFDLKVKNKFPENEIYYYTLDQIAGCYYSTKNYEKAAYLFIKVINHSEDRKKSAYNSFDFCVNNDFDGNSMLKTIDDQKDYQFIKSIRGFSDELSNMVNLIKLDANDNRNEVLFVRSINELESQMLVKNYGINEKIIPYQNKENNLKELIAISKNQAENPKVKNKDFWLLANSYLSFLNKDFNNANNQLSKVKDYKEQKSKLAIIYEVFSWDKISTIQEVFITESLNKFPKQDNVYGIQNDFQNIILDYTAHRYYKNNEIAKAFLVHNYIERADDISSLRLIDELETFYNKTNKSDFEKLLLTKTGEKHNFIDYCYRLKGVYYLHNFDPEMAMEFFNKISTENNDVLIPASIFSNNTIECFNCETEDVMEDLVYKADVFNFIKPESNLKELTGSLIQLQKMTKDETQWKSKLANYLIGNFYFNLSNTGFYRGALTNRYAYHYSYFGYDHENYMNGDDIIHQNKGYNLTDLTYYPKNYFGLSLVAAGYYKNVIEMSTDKELNARCLYLIAKCELNQMFNGSDLKTYNIKISKYNTLTLPVSQAFYELKLNYSDTKFHDMIIEECSYFKMYSERY